MENNEIVNTIIKNQNIKEAGKNVIRLFYCIIFEIIIVQIYDFLIDVKIEYFKRQNGIFENYESIKMSLIKSIINMDKIEKFITYLEPLDVVYFTFQLILLWFFLSYLWDIGINLKNVDEKTQ